MLKDSLTVMQELSGYGNPKTRLSRLLKAGTLIQVRRGLFVEGEAPPPQVSGPRDLRPRPTCPFSTPLAFHGLIPKGVPHLHLGRLRQEQGQGFLDALWASIPTPTCRRPSTPTGLNAEKKLATLICWLVPRRPCPTRSTRPEESRPSTTSPTSYWKTGEWPPDELAGLQWNQLAEWSPLYRSRPVALLTAWE